MWQTEMVTILRYMIADTDEDNYKYSDTTLQDLILVGALQANNEIDFSIVYTIRLGSSSISPDPTLEVSRDDNFIALASLKSAIIIIRGEFKLASNSAMMFRDRDTTVDLTAKANSIKAILQNFQNQYEESRWYYQLEKRNIGQAILGSLNIPFNQAYPYNTYGSARVWPV